MQETFKYWEAGRQVFLSFLDKYSLAQLNHIPVGYTNNLIWNIGHCVVIQQTLVYKLSGLEVGVSKELIEKYTIGTKPDGKTNQEEVDLIRKLLIDLVQTTKKDFEKNIFTNFKPYKTVTGFQLDTLRDAIVFNNYHEGIHFGFMLKIKKLV